ncbi:murein biosynthesis integral membrane protein MurJ [Catenulispora rubra]|uniref:murein biosynthesis integral membrane protein MurJ n=1 Tax=Catenulispora rubra TaxID=280293 RepID=UPI001891F419|nr:murein biosynthesis integral membrane protein MurJ [Catenulispora rubra]
MTSDGSGLWHPDPPREDDDQRPRRAPQPGPGGPQGSDPRHTPAPGPAPQQPWTPPSEPRFDPQTGRPLHPDPRAGQGRPPGPPQPVPQHPVPPGAPQANQPPNQSPNQPPRREQYAGPQASYRAGQPPQGGEQYPVPGAPGPGQRPDPRGPQQFAGPPPGRQPDPRQPDPRQPDPRQAAPRPDQFGGTPSHSADPRRERSESWQPAPPNQNQNQNHDPGGHGRRPIDDSRALFRDEVPGRGGDQQPPSWQPPQQDQRGAGPEEDPEERDWRDDYEDAVSATRWDLSPIPTMTVAPRRANPSNLEALIPPRRGRVQGPATRGPGGPAGTGPGTREGAPWEQGVRERTPTEVRPQAPAEPSVGRASRLMALGTLASRLTGLVRQFLLVAAIGTTNIAGSYTIGLNLPNMLYILIIGGALNAVFVPQLVRSMHRDRDGGAAYASRLLTLVLTGVLTLTVLTELFTPQLVDVFSSFKGSNRQLAIDLGRMFMPQIFFLGLFVVLGQILNAKGRFGPMMWTPVLTNVVVIGSTGAYWYINQSTDLTPSTIPAADVRLLGLGVTLGIAVQALTLLPYIKSAGMNLTLRFDWRGHGLGKAVTLAKWTLLFVLVNQIGLAVVMRYASNVNNDGWPQWGVAAYNNAYMIWGLPQALITVSVITALLPRMSRAAVKDDLESVREDISYGLRVTGVAIVPAAFAFLALGPQIAVVLFKHGGVSMDNAHIIGYMLSAFGLGLIPFSAQFLMLRGFYAFEDTKSPFTINIWISAANVTLSTAVFYTLKGGGKERWAVVAMCTVYGVAYCLGVVITARKLKRRLRGLDGQRIMQTYTRLIGASAVAAGATFIVALYVNRMVGQSWLGSAVSLAVGGGLLATLYVLCARLMHVEEVEQLLGSVRAKLGR